MVEFFKDYYAIITNSVEFIAAFTGIILWKKYRSTYAKYFIWFLVYVFFVDVIGAYPSHLRKLNLFSLIGNTILEKNYWWYIIFWSAGLTSFISLINYKIIYKSNYKKALKYCYYIYVVQFILYAIFNFKALFDPMEMFLKITSLWMILVAVFLYLLDILQSARIVHFYKSIYFYINIAVLLWVIITSPLMFYEIYFSTSDWNFVILKWQIYLSVNIIFYLTLSIALICCKPETK